MLKGLTHPRVFIPILLSLALLAFVLSISDASRVAGGIQRIPVLTMFFCLLLAIVYLITKGIQWHFFMQGLDIPITWRQLVLAFAVGEMAVPLPAGIYAQNYVLRRIACADFARSSAATTALLACEGGVSMLVVAILGIPGWDWLRPTIFGFFAAAGLVLATLLASKRVRGLLAGLLQMGPLRPIGPEFIELVEGLRVLFSPRIAARAVPFTAAYLLALVLAFYLVAQGVGLGTFTFLQAVTVYLFALSVVLVSPISSHLGVIEASGLGAMQAWGYGSTEALAALLGFRIVWTGAVWLVCGPVVLLFWREFTEANPEC